MKITEQLIAIQNELKVNKTQYNSFGKYYYRSLEDITEAAKPIAAKHGCVFTMSDEVIQVCERYYVKATATVTNTDGESVSSTAYAREALTKKGMDDSQITGTASTYARKYAAGGLFALDDTKDADTNEYRETTKDEKAEAREAFIAEIRAQGLQMDDVAAEYGINTKSTAKDFKTALKLLKEAQNDK